MLFKRTRSIHSKVELLPFEEQYVTELDSVVKFTVLLKPELFPAASCARTLKEYAVEATKPVIFAEVPVTVPMFVLPWKISYPVTPTLSVEAVHESVAVRSEEHTSELQSRENLVCRLLLEKKNK